MADSLNILNAKGDRVAVDLSVSMYKDAADAGQTLPQFLAQKYETNHDKFGSPFEQLLDQCGIYLRSDSEFGIRASSVDQILNASSANAVTKEGVAASRLLFPAVLLGVIDEKLQSDMETDANAYDMLVAVDDSINGDKFERPVLHFANAEKARSAPVAQLALPNAMMSITASDISRRIPTTGIGIEISHQAKNISLDLVSLAVARQALVERNETAQNNILNLLNGDVDLQMAALSAVPGAVKKAKDFDSTITAAGELTQTAWLKWLAAGSRFRTITHVVADLDTYLRWEARTGQPTSSHNISGVTKPNTTVTIINRKWPDNVQWFITDDPRWPANTIMGLDRRYGIHRVKSLTANYQAVEEFAIKRSTQMRFDNGEMSYRLFDEAFSVLALTV